MIRWFIVSIKTGCRRELPLKIRTIYIIERCPLKNFIRRYDFFGFMLLDFL
jgi:hypothetical protein